MNKKKLLLHVCCAPCGGQVVEVLSRDFALTGYYYNPNIQPADEHIKRLTEVERFFRQRNIPLVIAPTMESGPKSLGLLRRNTRIDPAHEKLIEAMVAVYSRAIDERIMTLEQIQKEEISAYMGTSPCNQVSNGLFMRLNGQVQLCPGRSDSESVYGNVHETPIAELWVNSPNYSRGDLANNWCAAKTTGMPKWLQESVLLRLNDKYGK